MTVDNIVCSNGRRFKSSCAVEGGAYDSRQFFFFQKDRFELIQQNLHCEKL